MLVHRTIIVGAGPSGLGCATQLLARKIDDFVVITKDVGGRALTSSDGQVNYGAYYVRSDYTHLRPYIKLKRQIHMGNVTFAHGRFKRSMYDIRNVRHLPRLLWLTIFLRRLYRHYLRAKKLSETHEQREVIEQDPLLHRLYTQSAHDFVQKHGLHFWSSTFIDPIVRSTAFINLRESNALEVLICILPLFVRTYEFEPTFERLIAPFFKQIKYDTVIRIEPSGTHWAVTTESGHTYHAQCVVVALPLEIAKNLVPIPEHTNKPVDVYMAHVRGVLSRHWGKSDYVLFPERRDDIVLARQENGTYMFYSHNPHYDLSDYFHQWEVIAKRHWKPAFHMGTHLLTMDRGNGLYVIGDHNLCSMEDSFTTGIFAANRIAERPVHH